MRRLPAAVLLLFATAALAGDGGILMLFGHDPFSATVASANAKSRAGKYAEAAKEWDEAIAKKPDAFTLKDAKEAADELRFRARWEQSADATSQRSLLLSLLTSKIYLEHAEPSDPRLAEQVKRLRKADPAFDGLVGSPITVAVATEGLGKEAQTELRDAVTASLKQLGLTAGDRPATLTLHAKWIIGPAQTGIRMPYVDSIPAGSISCIIALSAELSGKHPLSFTHSAEAMSQDEQVCRRMALERAGPALPVKLLREAVSAAASAH